MVHLHHSSKIKSNKEGTNNRNQGCFFIFLLVEGGIRIRTNTLHPDPDADLRGPKHTDPDPEPEH